MNKYYPKLEAIKKKNLRDISFDVQNKKTIPR